MKTRNVKVKPLGKKYIGKSFFGLQIQYQRMQSTAYKSMMANFKRNFSPMHLPMQRRK